MLRISVRCAGLVSELARDVHGLGQAEPLRGCAADRWCAGDDLSQRPPLDELHHQRADTIAFLESVNGGDVGMIQRGEDLRLAPEPRQRIVIVKQRIRQNLDRRRRD